MPDLFNGVTMSPQYEVPWAAESSALAVEKKAAVSGNRAKIEDAAREFESTLLSKWLEQARQSFAGPPGGEEEEDDGDQSGQAELIDLGMQSLATAVTKSGGFGIARMLCHEFQGQSRQVTLPNTQEEIASCRLPILTEIKSKKD